MLRVQFARSSIVVRGHKNTSVGGKAKSTPKGTPKGTRISAQKHPHPTQIQLSKIISWLLRHQGKAQGLLMRRDGYVSVKSLLSHPNLQGIDIFMLEKIVKEDAKKRFHILHEPHAQHVPGSSSHTDTLWIRANQGHSLPEVEVKLTPILRADEVPMAVHGTSLRAWDFISKQGISKMNRNHIHMAQGVASANVISGLRSTSPILIFINLQKALDAGIKFYLSENGVVLSPGNDCGFLEPKFFERVERLWKSRPIPNWETPTEMRNCHHNGGS